jgi:hypothetical protein
MWIWVHGWEGECRWFYEWGMGIRDADEFISVVGIANPTPTWQNRQGQDKSTKVQATIHDQQVKQRSGRK